MEGVADILNINGLELEPDRTAESDQQLVIGIARRPGNRWCPHCGSQSLAPNGTRRVIYRDVPVRGKPVTLEWDRQRFRCTEPLCRKSSSDTHEALHDEFQMTRRLVKYIGERAIKTTFAAVAADVGLDERTVRRVFAGWSAEAMASIEFKTPRWLGIDEVHLLHNARCVLTSIDDKTLLDILPNRYKETVATRVLRIPDREKIEVVAMDMYRGYERVAAELLPQAKVIIDKWHVLKYADLGLENVRKSLRAGLPAKRRRTLVHDRFLLLRRASALRPDQALIVETWTNQFPLLGAAYRAKEAFHAVYDIPEKQAAINGWLFWKAALPKELHHPFEPLLSALKNWHEQIFNYFDGNRITNAYTEAINGLIKIDNRTGRGYSFDVLRARMMLSRNAWRYSGLPPGIYPHVRKGIDPRMAGIDVPTLVALLEGYDW